jgi:AP-1 complex subunit beta-1
VFILDAIAANYEATDPRDAEKIVERVLPRLQHVNSAVVLSAVKVGEHAPIPPPHPGGTGGAG